MTKYHINPETGNPNKCVAQPGNCRFGSDENHYGSKDEARAAYEEHMSTSNAASHRRDNEERPPEPGEVVDWGQDENGEDYRLVHRFKSEFLPDAVAKIEKANKRLEKYGIEERFTYELEEKEVVKTTVSGMKLSESITTMRLNSPSIAINGNKFLAVVTQEEAGFITKTGRDVELNGWRPESQKCEHCGINRPRSKTYLIEDENGGRHQIGSSCVDAYLGVKPEGLWAIGEDPVGKVGWDTATASPRSLNRPTDHMIAYALAVSDEGRNFVSRSAAGWSDRPATADDIERALWSNAKEDREWAADMSAKAQEYLDNGKAKEILEEIRKTEGDTDYATNLRTVAAGEMMKPSNSGLLVSGLSAYRKKIEKAKKEEQPAASIGFAGAVGDKMKGKKATITDVYIFESDDPYSYNGGTITKTKLTFRDENNHELIWWASKEIEVEKGQEVTFKTGSIKNHDNYRGVDQTGLTRVKFEE